MTTDNPFGGAPGEQVPEFSPKNVRGTNKGAVIAMIVGVVLVAAGFVWKFAIGSVDPAAEAQAIDYAWMAVAVLGGIIAAVAARKMVRRD